MSKIEEALEKAKKKEKDNKIPISIPAERDKVDKVTPKKAVGKDVNINDYLSINNPKTEPYKNPHKHDSHITSAIKKSVKETASTYDLFKGHDPYAVDNVDIITEIGEIKDRELITREVCPSTKIDNYNVDERIVAYHDLVGKQTWKGPVMVHFRNLQVTLNKIQNRSACKVVNCPCKVFLFTSATQGEGKSLVALNTAVTLCNEKKRKIAFVNCDFRKHVTHRLLGFNPDKGLEHYLAEEAEIKEVAYNGLLPNLTVIPIGEKPSNACELLASDKMKQLISYLRERFDYVIIDTPPVLTFPDMSVLAPLSDGVVFVINSKKSKRDVVKRAIDTLSDCNIIGCVMNKSETAEREYYAHTNTNGRS
jgi:capsular exopolysaccharide synthesis family protein